MEVNEWIGSGVYISEVILTPVVHWVRLALSKWPNGVGVLSLTSGWDSFQNVVFTNFSLYPTTDKVQKHSNFEHIRDDKCLDLSKHELPKSTPYNYLIKWNFKLWKWSPAAWHSSVRKRGTNISEEPPVSILRVIRPWWCGLQVPLKHWHLPTKLHSITLQKTIILILNLVSAHARRINLIYAA
jgi:hypothetical protein